MGPVSITIVTVTPPEINVPTSSPGSCWYLISTEFRPHTLLVDIFNTKFELVLWN